MKDNTTIGLGLMSGTSLDGLDIALIKFVKENSYSFEILDATTISYSDELKQKLTNAFDCKGYELELLHANYGAWIGDQINEFLKNKPLKPEFVASHGHTIFHEPRLGLTTQIGSGAQIYARTGITTICDFRSVDVACGGQGAPLVPKGERELFSEYEFLLNLGGIANITYNPQSIAFDITIANMGLNYLAEKLGKNYDEEGNWASQGHLDHELLQQLNSFSFFKEKPPKSIGREFFEQYFRPILDNSLISVHNKLHTVCIHVAQQINKSLQTFKNNKPSKMLVSGGGVFNSFLIDAIQKECKTTEIIIPEPKIIAYKEALIFAFLGFLRINNEFNCLKTVTGATHDVIGGAVYGKV